MLPTFSAPEPTVCSNSGTAMAIPIPFILIFTPPQGITQRSPMCLLMMCWGSAEKWWTPGITEEKINLEVHIFDFNENLYDQLVSVELLTKPTKLNYIQNYETLD